MAALMSIAPMPYVPAVRSAMVCPPGRDVVRPSVRHLISLSRTGRFSRAATIAACSTRCVWYASLKSGSGTTGLPPEIAWMMSAAWLMKPC
jgi:hypothetical protein